MHVLAVGPGMLGVLGLCVCGFRSSCFVAAVWHHMHEACLALWDLMNMQDCSFPCYVAHCGLQLLILAVRLHKRAKGATCSFG
jgi:hypothetical protein